MTRQKLEFKAALFDGRSARRRDVFVTATPREIHLRFPDGGGGSWPYPGVRLSPGTLGADEIHLERDVTELEGIRTETLEVFDPGFGETLTRVAPLGLSAQLRRRSGISWTTFAVATLALGVFFFVAWEYVVPGLARKVAQQVPVKWEEQLGEMVFHNLFPNLPPPKNPQTMKVLNQVLAPLLETVPGQPYTIRLHVHPARAVNALALPGGHIIVFQGLLTETESPEELAGILAHELQHVLRRHSTQGVIRALASQMMVALLIGDVNGVMNSVLNMAGNLQTFAFSRELESEADREGMNMYLKAGLDPEHMIHMYRKLDREEKRALYGDDGEPPPAETAGKKKGLTEYFSTHPAGTDRVAQLEKMVEEKSATAYKPLLIGVDWASVVAAGNFESPEPGGKT